MTRDELLASLALERMTNPWWVTKPADRPELDDSDLATAKRRRVLIEACGDDEQVAS